MRRLILAFAGFRPFTSISFPDNVETLAAPGSDLVLTVGGVPFRTSDDLPQDIAIERPGPLRPVLRIEGSFVDAGGNPSPLRYLMRLHFTQCVTTMATECGRSPSLRILVGSASGFRSCRQGGRR